MYLDTLFCTLIFDLMRNFYIYNACIYIHSIDVDIYLIHYSGVISNNGNNVYLDMFYTVDILYVDICIS